MLIKVLPDLLVNQIAAGEVVEDPASVVKELVENAVDAGAKRIEIELIAGGHRLIRISDDGVGMSRDDAVLCFERHATSKVHTEQDLKNLLTMGFRGEALAAIASIGKVSLKTAQNSGEGTHVEIHGGKLFKVEPCARAKGTTIEVRDIFYNVPARRKFQKSSSSSGSKIEKWISLFSLGYPGVEFHFIENGKKEFLPQTTENFLDALHGRMNDVFGTEFANLQMQMDQKVDAFHFQGFISNSNHHRPQRNGQVLFINRRLVQSPLVSNAVREAYASRLPEGRHPLFVLHIDIPLNDVDVNVHPQKKEVRFTDEEGLRSALRKAVIQAFERETKTIPHFVPTYTDFQDLEKFSWTFQERPLTEIQQVSLPWEPAIPKSIAVFWQFLVIEGPQVVDLQKAVERILHDGLKNSSEVAKQKLLLPIKIELTKKESEELRTRSEEFDRLGIKISEMGDCFFLIEEIPSSWDIDKVKDAIISSLDQKPSTSLEIFQRCVKKHFLLQEAEEILRVLCKSSDPYFAPCGKPIMVPLEEHSLRKLFAHDSKQTRSTPTPTS